MDITIAKTPIEPVERKIDLGKWPVCSACGQGVFIDEQRKPVMHQECHNARVMSLRTYIEEVRGEKFDATKWKLDTHNVNLTSKFDLTSEIVDINDTGKA